MWGNQAVPGDERLGLGRLGVPHYPEPVVVWLEAHDSVVAHPELLPAPCEVDVLGRQSQRAGIRVDCFLPLDGPAPELAGAVVEALGDPDADPVGGALALAADDSLQVVHALDDPDELLGFHQVEGYAALDVLALGDNALGDLADDRGLNEGGVGAVGVDVLG